VTPIYKNLQILYRLCVQPPTRYLPINTPSDSPISSHFAPYMEGQIGSLSLLQSAVTDFKHHITFCLLGELTKTHSLLPLSFCPERNRKITFGVL